VRWGFEMDIHRGNMSRQRCVGLNIAKRGLDESCDLIPRPELQWI
jgi:hypothetical protein